MQVNVDLKLRTCSCGTVYAVAHWLNNYQCPCCAQRRHNELEDTIRAQREVVARQERVIRGLRGALTRRRRRS